MPTGMPAFEQTASQLHSWIQFCVSYHDFNLFMIVRASFAYQSHFLSNYLTRGCPFDFLFKDFLSTISFQSVRLRHLLLPLGSPAVTD